MPRPVWIALCLNLSVALPAFGITPDQKPASATPAIQPLIEQLTNRDFRVRDAAHKALAALGTEALPALIKGRAHSDPEVRRRLDELIPPLERAVTLMPQRVTLHMTNKSLKDVLAELSNQTKYKIAPVDNLGNGEADKVVHTFHFDKVPFWEALDRISQAGGLVLQHNYYGDDQLRLYAGDSYVPFNYYNGPFKVMATGFYYNRSNQFAQLPRNPAQQGQPTSESLQLNMTIAVEPKLPILKVGAVRLATAEDDEKNSMLPNVNVNGMGMWNQRFYYGGGYRSYVHQTQASLLWPSKTSRIVKTLKGAIPVTLLADQKPSVVTERILSAKGKKFTVGAATFNFDDVSEMPGRQYQIKLSVSEDAKDNPNDWTRIQTLQQRLELQDDKGNKQQFYFNSISTNGPNSAQFTFVVQPNGNAKAGPPTKLVYYAWILMEHEVDFELRDLPLP